MGRVMSKSRGFRSGARRPRRAPAPGLHPPGFGGALPSQNPPRLQPRDAAERQILRLVTRLQVRGEAVGVPNLMRADWDRMKLEEAVLLNEGTDKPVVDVVKLGRSRAMRAQFNGYARVISAASKSAERHLGRETEQSRQNQPGLSPAETAPSSLREADRSEEDEGSAFMKRLRARADELATRGQDREREQDRD